MQSTLRKTDLQWNVLTIRPPWPRSRLPPGKEELMVGGEFVDTHLRERDAILVDTFLTTEQSADSVGLDHRERQEPHRDLHHHGQRRSFLGLHRFWSVSRAQGRSRHPRSSRPCMSICHQHRIENFWRRLSRRDSRSLVGCRTAGRRRARAGGAQACRGERGADRYGSLTCLYVPSIGLIVAGTPSTTEFIPTSARTDRT